MSFEIYTDKMGESARTLIRRAYQEARARNDRELSPIHALIALAETEAALFDQLMKRLGLDSAAVLQAVSGKGDQTSPQRAGMKISTAFREVLHEGLIHARENGRRMIESIDLLFAFFAYSRSPIARVFRKLGVDPETVLRHIEDLNTQ